MGQSLLLGIESLIAQQDKLISLLKSDVESYKTNKTDQIISNQQIISTILTNINQLTKSLFQGETALSDLLQKETVENQKKINGHIATVRDKANEIVKQLSINSKITQANLLDLKLIWDQLTSLASDNNCTYNKDAILE